MDYFNPDIVSAQDYYPFGMMMVGREYGGDSYRYGFNRQEKSNEISNNTYVARYWEYDARIGRRWNIDPIIKDNFSGYVTFGNNPIFFKDPDGADWYKNKKGEVHWFDSHKKNLTINKNKFKNIGEVLVIKTVSFINTPNDTPLPDKQLQEEGAGDKLTTYITISPTYNNAKQLTGFKVNYKRIVGATFDLKDLLTGVDYPGRPNTKEGEILTAENIPGAKFKSLDFTTQAHVTTPPIETAGLNLIGRNVDVSQDITVRLNKNRLNIQIRHGSYPSVDMKIIGSNFMFDPSQYINYYRYQQESFLTSHAYIYMILNFNRVKDQIKEAVDLHNKLNQEYRKTNKARSFPSKYYPD